MTTTLWSIPASTLSTDDLKNKATVLKQRLLSITQRFSDVRFATSLAAEDMVLMDAIIESSIEIKLFTLHTGRLHQETIDFIKTTEDHYQIQIQSVYPQESNVALFVNQYGLNGFYDSEEAKKRVVGFVK